MDELFFAELADVMRRLRVDDDARAVVLTGTGRAFSAGGDVATFEAMDGDVRHVRPHLRRVYDALHSIERCAVPVIAAVNGIAFGGGTELALAWDVVLANAVGGFNGSVEATALVFGTAEHRAAFTAFRTARGVAAGTVSRGRSPRWARSPGSRPPRAGCAATGSARRRGSWSPAGRRARRT